MGEMIKVDLITGFLGSGKTTFLKSYARYLMDRGLHIGILENDYGAVNVDMLLLQDLRGKQCELEMVAGGCDADCHKRRLKTKLIAMGMSGYDRVIIEPSGIFDMDEFFDTLREEPLDRWYEIGSVITIVDGRLEEELSKEDDFYLASQIAHAGTILLSRSQIATKEEKQRTLAHLERAKELVNCQREMGSLLWDQDWSTLTEEDYGKIADSGYRISDYVKLQRGAEKTYSAVYFLEHGIGREKIEKALPILFGPGDHSWGTILRLKGFYREGGQWQEINATKKEARFAPVEKGQEVLIVIGCDLKEEEIQKILGCRKLR